MQGIRQFQSSKIDRKVKFEINTIFIYFKDTSDEDILHLLSELNKMSNLNLTQVYISLTRNSKIQRHDVKNFNFNITDQFTR